jgi:hypothetical protein
VAFLSLAVWRRFAEMKFPFLCAVALAASALPTHRADAQRATQHQVEAVFLYRFTEFVEWPPEPARNSLPFCIGVLGKDPFGTDLAATVRGESVGARDIEVRHLATAADAAECEMVFVSASERSRLPEILRTVAGHSVLTVADFDGFALAGGIVEFVVEESRTRLKINLNAARLSGLTIDSKLLRAAEIIGADR